MESKQRWRPVQQEGKVTAIRNRLNCCAPIAALQLMIGDLTLTSGDTEWEDKVAEEVRNILSRADNESV
jgi:hypothetical protein